MDQEKFLKNFAKLLGAEDTLKIIEEKQERENKQKEEKKDLEKKILESFSNSLNNLVKEKQDKTEIVEKEPDEVIVQRPPILVEEVPPVPSPAEVVINEPIKFNQIDPIPAAFRKELDNVKELIQNLHKTIARQSSLLAGSSHGGGAGSVEELKFHTTTVNEPAYQIGRKDYYVGVNYPGSVNIILPTQNVKAGRQVIVKDESGICSTNNITITGTSIDNNTTAILAIDNGSLTFIYNNGWRII